MNKIPVFFSTDDAYVFPTCVTIHSMMINKNDDTFYEIVVMVTSALSDLHRENLLSFENLYDGCSIRIEDDIEQLFANSESKIPHISNVAFYRLAIPELFPEYDKCIYLDGDMIVLGDLFDAYNVEFGDNYIAGVKNYRQCGNLTRSERHRQRLEIPSMEGYIIGSPIIFNCKSIRENNVTESFMEHIVKGYTAGDQDVLNICCYGRIKHLPLSVSVLNRFIYLEDLLDAPGVYSTSEINDAKASPLIIHYAGGLEKPWVYSFAKKADLWWDYAKSCSAFPEYEECKNKLIGIEKFANAPVINKIYSRKRVCLYGLVKDIGLKYEWIRQKVSDGTEVIVTDKNKEKLEACNLPYIYREELASEYEDAIVYVLPINRTDEIKRELLDLGIDEKNIIIPIYKNNEYYMALDPKYHQMEVNDIMEIEGVSDIDHLPAELSKLYHLGLWYCDEKFGELE